MISSWQEFYTAMLHRQALREQVCNPARRTARDKLGASNFGSQEGRISDHHHGRNCGGGSLRISSASQRLLNKLRDRRGQEAGPHAQSQYLPLVGFHHFEVQAPILELLAGTRDVACDVVEQSRYSRRGLIRFIAKLDPK